MPATLPLSATSITGYSGGGKKMIEQYEAGGEPALTSPRPYGLTLAHKHLPEMLAHTGLQAAAGVHAHRRQLLQGPGGDGAAAPVAAAGRHDAPKRCTRRWCAHYAGERFIRVMPLRDADTLEDGFFDVQACNDTNRVDLFVFASDTQVLLMARLDNLGKGASGAAVQAMNVHLGVDEGLGL